MYDFAAAMAEGHQDEQNIKSDCRNSEKLNRTLISLPGPLDLNFQKSLKPLRCQWTTVSGFTDRVGDVQGFRQRDSK